MDLEDAPKSKDSIYGQKAMSKKLCHILFEPFITNPVFNGI